MIDSGKFYRSSRHHTQPDHTKLARGQAGPPNSIANYILLPVLLWPLHAHFILFNQFIPVRNCRWPYHIAHRYKYFPDAGQELDHCSRERKQRSRGIIVLSVCDEPKDDRCGCVDGVDCIHEHVRAENTVRKAFAVAAGALICGRSNGAADCETRGPHVCWQK